jgi:acetolactate synthase-1/2/3 large subunit
VTVGEAVIGLLEQQGVRTVFGIPGVHTLELYRGLGRSSIRHVTPRHEQGAAFMADGWTRTTGEPGVCIVISGPGVTNALTPVAQAYHDSKPLLVVSAVVPAARRGRGDIHDLPDQRGLTGAVTAFSHTVTDPAELPEVLARAWDVFDSGRPRPVHIEIPVDVLTAPCEALTMQARSPSRPQPGRPEIQAATRLLLAAERPAMILGGGAADAGAEADRLCTLLGAPVGLTINARGTIPWSHPLCLGSALSFDPVDEALLGADVLLAVGTEFSELDWWGRDGGATVRGRVVRVDIDPGQLDTPFPAAVGIAADAASTLAALADEVSAGGAAGSGDAPVRTAQLRSAIRWPAEVSDHFPLLDALDAALPSDRIVAADSTQPGYAANHALPLERPRSWLMPIGFGCLGCALPMAIGAKLAAPERPVLALAGDGGVLFTLQELATAAQERLALPLVVWNNAGYGEIRDSMTRAGFEPVATDATARDFPTLARGFGCHGVRAGSMDEVRAAIAAALGADAPTLIEVPAP